MSTDLFIAELQDCFFVSYSYYRQSFVQKFVYYRHCKSEMAELLLNKSKIKKEFNISEKSSTDLVKWVGLWLLESKIACFRRNLG